MPPYRRMLSTQALYTATLVGMVSLFSHTQQVSLAIAAEALPILLCSSASSDMLLVTVDQIGSLNDFQHVLLYIDVWGLADVLVHDFCRLQAYGESEHLTSMSKLSTSL